MTPREFHLACEHSVKSDELATFRTAWQTAHLLTAWSAKGTSITPWNLLDVSKLKYLKEPGVSPYPGRRLANLLGEK